MRGSIAPACPRGLDLPHHSSGQPRIVVPPDRLPVMEQLHRAPRPVSRGPAIGQIQPAQAVVGGHGGVAQPSYPGIVVRIVTPLTGARPALDTWLPRGRV